MPFNIELLKKSGFSDKAIIYVNESKNVGEIKDFDAKGEAVGDCGDIIITYLKIDDDIIKDAKFLYTGCVGSASSGSAITEMSKGKSLNDAQKFTLDDVLDFYKEGDKGLPRMKHECAEIAINSIKNAIEDYKKNK